MASRAQFRKLLNWLPLALPILTGLLLLVLFMGLAQVEPAVVHADPIDPPEGYPKFNTSIKTVSPTLAHTGGVDLFYIIEIRNTGAYTGFNTSLIDVLTDEVTLNGAESSVQPDPHVNGNGNTLSWTGDVGFNQTVVISFNVTVSDTYSGEIVNTATISNPMIDEPVTVSAVSVITDDPILTIEKTAVPAMPGANKPLTYTIIVGNEGQPAVNIPITVTDQLPANTSPGSVEPGGEFSQDFVSFTRTVNLDTGETTSFVFSVDVSNVSSGTVIANNDYQVESALGDVTAGEPYTVTVVDPELWLVKEIWPDPPGSNRQMTYTLTLLNLGSLATNLVITDRVPANVTYVSGGTLSNGVVSWSLPELGTNETAQFSYTVSIGDVMDTAITNDDYGVCSDEGVCQSGHPLVNGVEGPNFVAWAEVDPIAKKPGGGNVPLTPTLVVHNLGPGNAYSAHVRLQFERISTTGAELVALPDGDLLSDPEKCGDKCRFYTWEGHISYGETITFTTLTPMSTIGGEEGTNYTATIVVTDTLANSVTEPVTATAIGRVTHLANLIPEKTAPPVIGNGMLMTYTISVWNSGLSTDEPPSPSLSDTVPEGTSLVRVNNGGVSQTVGATTMVSWTLPAMSPGDVLERSYVVLVDEDLISGTLIVNDGYFTSWYEIEDKKTFTNTGQPFTTTVREVGLIDSFKEVDPNLVEPGPDNTLTYTLHIVNSSPNRLNGVSVYDFLPWQHSTYQLDAIATSGQIISDIVSIEWSGDVEAFSSELITITVLVDPGFEGVITNTAVITHSSLLNEVWVDAVTYITDKPILKISKDATPETVRVGDEILYSILVENLGQQATGLMIEDTLPENTSYVPGSANPAGQIVGDQLQWQWPALAQEGSKTFTFRVIVNGGDAIVNDDYSVNSADGVSASGPPVVTVVEKPILKISKEATPETVKVGDEILYNILVENLGQQATGLIIEDTLPKNTSYVPGSANLAGQLVGNQLQWQWPILAQEGSKTFTFRVTVDGGNEIVNDDYSVSSSEGVTAWGAPVVVTVMTGGPGEVYLPIILKK